MSSWTVQSVLTTSTAWLAKVGSETARLDAEVLIAHALSMRRIDLYINFDKPLTLAERETCRHLLQRRAKSEPVAYITGAKEFFGLNFAVTPAVLIPRADTEVLVETALATVNRLLLQAPRILDVGTGSGCIALALASRLSEATVTAWDESPEALAVAAQNAAALGLAERVTLKRRDALAGESWDRVADDGGPFDLIVANPPYIPSDDLAQLEPSVRAFEPTLALSGGHDGLDFYRALAKSSHALTESGTLLVEIGAEQAASASQIFREHGWPEPRVYRDYARKDRVLHLSAPGGP